MLSPRLRWRVTTTDPVHSTGINSCTRSRIAVGGCSYWVKWPFRPPDVAQASLRARVAEHGEDYSLVRG